MEITDDQKLYVLLKYKKDISCYQKFQMRLIGFFFWNKHSWVDIAEKWAFLSNQVYGDEPTEGQLKEYETRGKFHKEFPKYTHSTSIYLKELWNESVSNPKNWWRNKWVIGTSISVLALLVALWQLLG